MQFILNLLTRRHSGRRIDGESSECNEQLSSRDRERRIINNYFLFIYLSNFYN